MLLPLEISRFSAPAPRDIKPAMAQCDPVVVDSGFEQWRRPDGFNIIEPFLVLAIEPDQVWHLRSGDLFTENVFKTFNRGDRVPWTYLQSSGLLHRRDWVVTRSMYVVREAYNLNAEEDAQLEDGHSAPRTIPSPHTPTEPPPSEDSYE